MGSFTGFFILTGAILLSGLALDYLGKKTGLPRVTLLLLFGLLIGPSGFNFFTEMSKASFPLITDVALLMIGFLLGGQLTRRNLRKHGRVVLAISLLAASLTAIMVLTGLLLLGINPQIALLLAGIATATAPAATVDIVHEMKARGAFTQILLGVVAIDDAWGLIIFVVMLTGAGFYAGEANVALFLAGIWDLAGAILVGIGLGVPAAFLTGRIQPGEPMLVEALGVIFLCGGAALALDVSIILAAMIMGATIANLAVHHIRPFHAIEHIESPFMILFFVLAGASLHIDLLLQLGSVGVAYIVFRALGKISGAWCGAVISHAPGPVRRWTGMALMPQAGIALGMALLAEQRLPGPGSVVLSIVIGAVVIFELFGPLLTRIAINRAGDANH